MAMDSGNPCLAGCQPHAPEDTKLSLTAGVASRDFFQAYLQENPPSPSFLGIFPSPMCG
ncbi:MAG: hypothetical protein SNJ67_02190 [Chloracidobacterium sp.]|uniref:Uncharacterized protein n=1 Tax=Chloracidobacterium validum TaxID=2821543 RepID=A0ABX8B9U8_9BACT|nr:hypothetical protein [Chloracidobacterium validum]QUW02330.1 hypothetical protein J8C06_08170 [Chloracidobacterium validum]